MLNIFPQTNRLNSILKRLLVEPFAYPIFFFSLLSGYEMDDIGDYDA
jgi:hypothetical protein